MDEKPEIPIAKPIVPILNAATRLSTISTPIFARNRFRKLILSLSAVRSGSFGQVVTVPGMAFFWSTPAFGVSTPCLIVRMNPFTPPRIASDSSIIICASRLSILHLALKRSASFEGRTRFSWIICPSEIDAILLATDTTSPVCGVRPCCSKARMIAESSGWLARIFGSFTGITLSCLVFFLRRSLEVKM